MSSESVRALELVLVLAFTASIADVRRKNDMVRYVHVAFIALMKLSAVVAIPIYLYLLWTMRDVAAPDYLGLLFVAAAPLLTITAKRRLGRNHQWTGYFSDKTALVTGGIYAFVRHPLYLGILSMIVGMTLTLTAHAPRWMMLVEFPLFGYITGFLLVAMRRENLLLAERFRDEYSAYRGKVALL